MSIKLYLLLALSKEAAKTSEKYSMDDLDDDSDTSTPTHNEVEEDNVLHQAITLRDFLGGEITAGEELFEISSRQTVTAMEMWMDVLSVVLKKQSYSDSRSLELACGICANLLLNEFVFEGAITLLEHILELLSNSTCTSDPYIISEILRVFTNLSYKNKGYLLTNSSDILQYTMYLAENSLSPRVLAQLFQFLYYFQVYSPDSVDILYKTWNIRDFFQFILYNDAECIVDTSIIIKSNQIINNKEINTSLIQSLQEEKLGTNNGFEWFLFCLDHTTTAALSYPILFSLLHEEYLINIFLDMLLSTTITSTYNDKTILKYSAKLPNISLQINEIFLVLSILESIGRSYEVQSGTGSSTGTSTGIGNEASIPHFPGIVLNIVEKYNNFERKGVEVLLLALLEYCEDAVLMRDEYAIVSIAYLVYTIYSTSDNNTSTSSTVLLRILNVVEVLELDTSKHWLAETRENTERITLIVSMLQVLLHILQYSYTSISSSDGIVVNRDKLIKSTLNLINTLKS